MIGLCGDLVIVKEGFCMQNVCASGEEQSFVISFCYPSPSQVFYTASMFTEPATGMGVPMAIFWKFPTVLESSRPGDKMRFSAPGHIFWQKITSVFFIIEVIVWLIWSGWLFSGPRGQEVTEMSLISTINTEAYAFACFPFLLSKEWFGLQIAV